MLSHGLPDKYGWSLHPRVSAGNNVPLGFKGATAPGGVYEQRQGSSATNTRVEVRNIKLLALSKSKGKWECVQSSIEADGRAYVEDFHDNIHHKVDLRPERDHGLSVFPGGGFVFHFWPVKGIAKIDLADIQGIISSFDAKLVVDDPRRADDRSKAHFVAVVGGDYWFILTIPNDPSRAEQKAATN